MTTNDQVRPISRVPAKPSLEGVEERWLRSWESSQIYRFDRKRERDEVFSIDTPPPTVSGALHVGHIFSYTQTDIVARYKRMKGLAVFYPIGWDDNGLPTERRVQNFFSVRCDPSVAYDAGFDPDATRDRGEIVAVSRPNFVELCERLSIQDEQAFEEMFKKLGLSVDWTTAYTTIGERSRRASQRAFLRQLSRGETYRREAPTLWDVDFQSAVAQAELEDREIAGALHRIKFGIQGGGFVVVETTRPELLGACVALVANPSDERYRELFGKSVTSPLFHVEVPVLAHRLAEPDKGTGIAMVCTFGDLNDVTWWRELSLPTRTIIGRDGRLESVDFGSSEFPSTDGDWANATYSQIEGKTARAARNRTVELLRESGDMIGEPSPISHPVKFYERGDRPLEIVSSHQWYVRTIEVRDELIEAGQSIDWHPDFMRSRYESWVNGLTGDWNISRQRFFGVPFPIWYQVREDGSVDEQALITPSEDRLPIDPSVDCPDGYLESQRDAAGGFAADPDVMDTWATSSLSPQIVGQWEDDNDLFQRIFPMDLRPQAHEIIRTWLFSSVVRSYLEHHVVPWKHAAISGWILDPDRKKMSKSKGNVVVPNEILEEHGTDAVRYWAGSARLGVDTIFDEQQMRIGRRLAIKILNASKFALDRVGDEVHATNEISEAIDLSMLFGLREVISDASAALEGFEQARALDRVEQFFWHFCDDYVELVKGRSYESGPQANSAKASLQLALSVILRCFAPFLPFVTEEVWSWFNETSIHASCWPTEDELAEPYGLSNEPEVATVLGGTALFDDGARVLGEIRRAKTGAKVSMRAEVEHVEVRAPDELLRHIVLARSDICSAGHVADLVLEAHDGPMEVLVTLQSPDRSA